MRAGDSRLTQSELKERYSYNPRTGQFYSFAKGEPVGYPSVYMGTPRSIVIRIKGHNYKAQNLAWLYVNGVWPSGIIDHENGNPLDNRLDNLRDIPRRENARNMAISKRNKTGIVGVQWFKKRQRWLATIGVGGRPKWLGQTSDFFEACCLRKSAELVYGYHPNHGKRAKPKVRSL